MSYDLITTESELDDYCRDVAHVETLALDTEFVSEYSYRSQLCLIQLWADRRLTIIDPLAEAMPAGAVGRFWQAVVDRTGPTIVHAGREELLFCHGATGRFPQRLIDVQLAAAFIGLEYPASYGNLSWKLTGQRPHKTETRTDWRKRPLSKYQMTYALDDVRYLDRMHQSLHNRLGELGRVEWLESETAAWLEELRIHQEQSDRWWRTSGISGLAPRTLAVVRELWRWRELEAQRRNSPPRRVLRDDLLVELAKRQVHDPQAVRALRGMERGDLRGSVDDICAAIRTAMHLSEDDLPHPTRRDTPTTAAMLAQFLGSALSSICHEAEVAVALVGTASDVRDFISHRLGDQPAGSAQPALATGWRAEVVGRVLDDLLTGRTSIRIGDVRGEAPLVFEAIGPGVANTDR